MFLSIFRENNNASRKKFFGDPLVKHLWGKIFVIEFAELYKSCLRKLRSSPENGELKFMRLFKHMLQLEEQFNFRVLPACARNPHNLKVFNQEEEIEYFNLNCKYIKRHRKDYNELKHRIATL